MRVYLSPLQKKDASKVFEYWSDEEVTRYMNIEPFTTLYQAESMIALLQSLTKEGKATRYAIRLKTSDEIIGTCGLNRIDYIKKQAEIGYDLGRPFLKKGLMTEALCLLLEKAFEEFHIQEIEAKVDPNNKDSITLLKKFSFQLEEAYESNDCTCLYTVNKEKVSAILSGRSKGKK
ncbi:GNAT family N-acetyltransferase [Priestia megaterium]|uniref:GNAT family N-acetyltransferase n=1 Tax=Priestia megaterium TaxID=1404 RepID=UPI0013E329C2|nr:GNAT family N-acetyltransferase [Priestia megaterium]MED3865673.1 GNAT family N-acetyltransferase [Priestia megaterium]MED4098981.1 GNAT family N-acetyltransferase [Priestia megaterium]MED4146772.1 GNAT family N-acetyltransferase [Priestia megaterium]MED4166108.1 GNAT family N-acetyltransferase [Priestia megaterium]MED4200163.1 GNAT family N-acetyltransferase [Priestia megaterium]